MRDRHIIQNPYTEWGMTIVTRLNKLCKTICWLADKMNLKREYLSKVLRGRGYISEEQMSKIDTVISTAEKEIA